MVLDHRGVGRLLRRGDGRLPRRRQRRTCSACAARGSGCWSCVTLLGSVAGQMRSIALSTCVTLLVPEDRRGPGQRHGRHGHRRLLRDHLGVQRPGHRPARHGLGVLRRRSRSRSSRSSTCAPSTSTSRSRRRSGGRGATEPRRHPRRARRDPRGARPDAADPAGRLQQPARRRVHGADRRLRALARVGRDLGLPVRASSAWPSSPAASSWPATGSAAARCGSIIVGNLVNWVVCSLFALRSSIVMLTIGMVVWLALIPVIEAAEQTVLQRLDPVRAPGPGLRLRAAGRERRGPADRVPHRADRRDRRSCRS